MLDQQEKLFNELVRDNQASIYRICRAYLYDTSHADDLYQEILFQVWKSIQSFKGQSRVSTWIYRIAVNTAVNFNLQSRRHQHQPLPELIQIPFEETLGEKQEQEIRLDKLRYCISQLEVQDRLIISLVLEEKSYKDIAEITGSNVGLIGVKINRIKARLLKLMENKNDK
ncbi:MAG: RNA polymerase sigma factor [Sphingobacteriaceae bacterium]|nr:MAG: RNA polymerase sigma factor [Sphingobacteriaceae bacterium]